MKKQKNPSWWLVDILVLLLAGSLLMIHWLHLATRLEMLLQILLVVGFYGLVALWLWANSTAISQEDRAKESCRGRLPQPLLTQVQTHYQHVMTRYIEREKTLKMTHNRYQPNDGGEELQLTEEHDHGFDR
jgi:hypothetical protein